MNIQGNLYPGNTQTLSSFRGQGLPPETGQGDSEWSQIHRQINSFIPPHHWRVLRLGWRPGGQARAPEQEPGRQGKPQPTLGRAHEWDVPAAAHHEEASGKESDGDSQREEPLRHLRVHDDHVAWRNEGEEFSLNVGKHMNSCWV